MNLPTNPTAQAVDSVLIYIFGFSLLLLLGITVVTLYFIIKYRRSKYPEPTSEAHGSFWLEAVWTLLPTLIVLTMFWYGWTNYLGLRNVPEGAMEVKATARMWSWQFEYPDGRKANKLYVPVGQPIKVDLVSTDVLHSFFAPAFRIKRDAVPGMQSHVWFEATEPGSYDIFCAEFCGTGHAAMITTIEALPPEEYAAWLQPAEPTGEPRGLIVINEQGCTGCHSLDGSEGIAPSLFQLAGQLRKVIVAGQSKQLTIDEDYLRRAIRDPELEMVDGFDPMMPAYDADTISDADLQAVIDYLLGKIEPSQTLKLDGKQLIENYGCLGCHSQDGSELVGPSFKGIGEREVRIDRDGANELIKVDRDYLIRAIKQPSADIVEGYPPIMPEGDYLSDEEVEAMVEHLLKQ
ncbi:MAG TPA: cytochrome c oxidase subunit II [Malonomonas sp.]